jgi:hypothetical protein
MNLTELGRVRCNAVVTRNIILGKLHREYNHKKHIKFAILNDPEFASAIDSLDVDEGRNPVQSVDDCNTAWRLADAAYNRVVHNLPVGRR